MARRKGPVMTAVPMGVMPWNRPEIEIAANGPDLNVGLPPHDKMNWESIIGKGENPRGYTSQTVNGTAHATGTGYNKAGPCGGWPELEPDPTRPAGRSNRTGE